MSEIVDAYYVAHNTFVSILVEGGAVGAGIFLVWLAALCSCVYVLPQLERRLWIVLLLTWAVGVFSRTWEHKKPTWLLFGLLTASAGAFRRARGSDEKLPASPKFKTPARSVGH